MSKEKEIKEIMDSLKHLKATFRTPPLELKFMKYEVENKK